ncbi:MAG: RDD family protein [Desulfobacterales bacterium]|nr:RDD family protein [Desulfobacterales bacterium]
MEWYYSDGKNQFGPVSDEEFFSLINNGEIGFNTLVWNEKMTDWIEFEKIKNTIKQEIDLSNDEGLCSECGKKFFKEEMISYNNIWVCSNCKSLFIQKIKEGVNLKGIFEYGGFWIRAGAKFIDFFIIYFVQISFSMLFAFLSRIALPQNDNYVGYILLFFFALFPVFYSTFMIGRFGATIGKMACGLRVVRPDGSKIEYWRALGRYFGELISGLILGIGYFLAATNEEKCTLHDMICKTRVIKIAV